MKNRNNEPTVFNTMNYIQYLVITCKRKVGLKLNIQKTKTMASSPITSWQIDGETVVDFNFWAPKPPEMVIAAMKLKDTP